jgi:hypothetical protein
MSSTGAERPGHGSVLVTTAQENPVSPGASGTFRTDWRYFAALVICLAILVAVGAAMFHSNQNAALLHSPSSVVNSKPAGG